MKRNYKSNYKVRKINKSSDKEITPYQVEVFDNDVDRAYRKLVKMLKRDRVLEDYIERQRYKKPSDARREHKNRIKRQKQKELEKLKEMEN